MARSRNIKPGFFVNDELVELPFEIRLLFIGLWTLADREGRLEKRPKKIKMALFPADDVDVAAGLEALEEGGFLLSYRGRFVDDLSREREGEFVQIVNWHKHQKPHHMEAESIIPPPAGMENRFNHKPIYKKQRERILERDGHQCVECGSTDDLQIDHVVPVTKGGTSEDDNLQVLCGPCNGSKGNRIDDESSTNRPRIVENGSCPTDSGYLIPDSGCADSGDPPPVGAHKSSRVVPEDWQPNPITERQAKPAAGVDRDFELRQFRLHEFQNPRSDWDRAWAQWLNRATPRKQQPGAPPVARVSSEQSQHPALAAEREARRSTTNGPQRFGG